MKRRDEWRGIWICQMFVRYQRHARRSEAEWPIYIKITITEGGGKFAADSYVERTNA